jgi:coproporphyrinogen III oxidase
MGWTSMREKFEKYILGLQDTIITDLEQLDPNAPPFFRDRWDRPEGGYGISSVFSVPFSPTPATTILEKAGVNISVIHGTLPPAAVKQMRADHGNPCLTTQTARRASHSSPRASRSSYTHATRTRQPCTPTIATSK